MENIKSKIIPNSMKGDIDTILEKQLFNANRYYAESNPNISQLMVEELQNDPMTFLNELKRRWKWHNEFYENLLEPSFENIVRDYSIELSPNEIEEIIKVFSTSCFVDEATLVMSGAIKKYLDYKCNLTGISSEDIKSSEAAQLLITPPVETFFAQYQMDHLFYIYLIKYDEEHADDFKRYILKKYHADDIEIFESRFNKRFEKYLDFSISEKDMLEEIKKYAIPEEYKTKHFYFTLEHPDRKAIRDIIIYDNLDEKLIASNLIGISGFLLRKKVLDYLNESNILNNGGYIYEYNKEIIISKLKELKAERSKVMDKNVNPYKQRGDTCAICCLMMALEYFNVMEKANWYDERRLYKIYGSKYISGTPFSALAYHFSKNGLATNLYHEDENLFNNNKGVLENSDFDLAMIEYKNVLNRAESIGTNIVNGITINTQLIKNELEDGKLVIAAGEVTGGYHAILISGYENDKFIVCDPLYKTKQTRTKQEVEDFMNTSIGKWFISVKKQSKIKNELLEKLNKFEKDAKIMMNINKSNKEKQMRKNKNETK